MFRRVLPMASLLVLAVACHPSQVRPTPPPPFAGRPISSVPTSEVVAYAQTLQFDTTRPGEDTLTIHTPVGDTIHLVGDPEIGAAALSDSDIVAGRIIARIHSNAPFTPLGVAAGTTYFWVSGQGDRAQGVMIPADSLARRFTRPLIERREPARRFVSWISTAPESASS
jgi:hypothetical protein